MKVIVERERRPPRGVAPGEDSSAAERVGGEENLAARGDYEMVPSAKITDLATSASEPWVNTMRSTSVLSEA